MHYASLCAIIKDEDRDIHEWLAYHLAVGFEHIFIYDNNSAVPLRDTLAEHIAAGLVTVTDWPLKEAQQLSAYMHALKAWGPRTRWLAFMDVDEFVLPLQHDDIRDFLDGYTAYGAVGANWAMFGSNGHMRRPAGGILENYTQNHGLEPHIKCIVQPAYVERPVSAHHFAFRPGAWCVNEDEVPVAGFMSYPLAEKLRINHYYYKSQQDFQDKIARGLVTQMKHGAERRMQNFYDHLGEPASFDDMILRHAARVREYRELGAQELAARVNACAAADAGALARDIERALEKGDVEEALRQGRILARHHEGLELPAAGAPAGKAADRMAQLKKAITTRMRQPNLPLEELRECYVRLADYYTLCGRPQVARAIGAWLG